MLIFWILVKQAEKGAHERNKNTKILLLVMQKTK
jgi:hypothetical protein